MSNMEPSKTFALLVGIEEYGNPNDVNGGNKVVQDIDGPVKDVLGFVEWLLKAGVPADNISVFLSHLPNNKADVENIKGKLNGKIEYPSEDNIRKEIHYLQSKGTVNSSFFFHWSGHGIATAGRERLLYYADLSEYNRKNLNFWDLFDTMQTFQYKNFANQIFTVDACADHHDRNETHVNNHPLPNNPLKKLGSRVSPKQYVFFAAPLGGKAANDNDRKKGTFSSDLLEILQTPANIKFPLNINSIVNKLQEKNRNYIIQAEDEKGNYKSTESSSNQKPIHSISVNLRSDKAVILDFDGIVVDTEEYHLRAYNILLARYQYYEDEEKFKNKINEFSSHRSNLEVEQLENGKGYLSWKDYKKIIELPTRKILDYLVKKYPFLPKDEIDILMEAKNLIYMGLVKESLEPFDDIRNDLEELFHTKDWTSLEKRGLYSYFKRGLKPLQPREGLENLLKLLKDFNWNVAIISLSTEYIVDSVIDQVASGLSSKVQSYFKRLVRYCFDPNKVSQSENSSVEVDSERESVEIKTLLYKDILNQKDEEWHKERIIAIDDGYQGVKAAKEAGFSTIFVPLHSSKTEGKDCDQLTDITYEKLMGKIRPRVFHISKSLHAYSRKVYDLLNSHDDNGRSQVLYKAIDIRKASEIERPDSQVKRLNHLSYYADTQFLPDSLIISPAKDSNAEDSNPTQNDRELAEALDKLGEKGVKIITLDTEVDKPKKSKSTSPWVHISPNFFEGGRMAAATLVKAMENRGGVIIFAGPKYHPSALKRRLGFLDAIAKYAPDVKLLGIEYCRFTSVDIPMIEKVVKRLVEERETTSRLPGGIFCEADILAKNVLQAYKGLNEEPPIIVGFDGIKEEIAREIADEKIIASIDVKVEEQVKIAWDIATTGKKWNSDALQYTIAPEILDFPKAQDYLRDIR